MELLAIFLVVPIALYFIHERGRGRVWGLVAAGEETRGAGAYREARVRTWKRGAAPLTVRVAAISSFFLGQMIVPGALAALIGLIAAAEVLASGHGSPVVVVLELSAPTGLIVAAQLLSAGTTMLSRADDAPDKARVAARWAIGHNVALLIALGLVVIAAPSNAIDVVPSVIYASISIAQALLLRRAAAELTAYARDQADDPAPLEAELQILHRAS